MMDQDALALLNQSVRDRKTRLWHGGAPGRKVGELLLPPASTEMSGMRSLIAELGFLRVTADDERVYVTTERDLAAAFAAYWSKRSSPSERGWLYRVELADTDLQPDADLPRGPFISFELPKARVAAVVDRGVDEKNSRHERVLQKFVDQIR